MKPAGISELESDMRAGKQAPLGPKSAAAFCGVAAQLAIVGSMVGSQANLMWEKALRGVGCIPPLAHMVELQGSGYLSPLKMYWPKSGWECQNWCVTGEETEH